MRQKYQVKNGDKWITAKIARETDGVNFKKLEGCLHYVLKDNMYALANPGEWRIKPEKGQRITI